MYINNDIWAIYLALSYNVYLNDTRISYTLLWLSSIDNECKCQILSIQVSWFEYFVYNYMFWLPFVWFVFIILKWLSEINILLFIVAVCCVLSRIDWSATLSLNNNINVLLYLNSSIFSIINIQWNHRVNWPSFSTLYKNEPPLSLVKSWIVIADTTQTFLKLEQTIEMCSQSFSFPTGFLFQSAFSSQ